RQREARRNDRQILERPLAALDVELLRHDQLEQMAYRGGQDGPLALEVVALARKAAKRACDVGSDRRFLCNDEFFGHAPRKAADDKCKGAAASTAHDGRVLATRAQARVSRPQFGRRGCAVLKRSSARRWLVGVF